MIGFKISAHIGQPIGLKEWFSVLVVYWDYLGDLQPTDSWVLHPKFLFGCIQCSGGLKTPQVILMCSEDEDPLN